MARTDHLFQQLLTELGNLVRSSYAPGEMLPSERVLADMYGVSKSTARRALHKLGEDGMLQVRPRLGWMRAENDQAHADFPKTPKTSRPLRLGIMTYWTNDQVMGEGQGPSFFKHLRVAAEKRGMEVVLDPQPRRSKRTPMRSRINVSRVPWNDFDVGLIFDIYDAFTLTDPAMKKEKALAVDQDATAFGIDSVSFENREVGRMAAQYLYELGHRRFALLDEVNDVGWSYDPTWLERRQGFEMFVSRYGALLRPGWRLENSRHRHDEVQPLGIKMVQNWLQESLSKRPTALFATEPRLVPEIAAEYRRKGLRIPRDLSIMTVRWDTQEGRKNARPEIYNEDTDLIPSLTAVHLDLQALISRTLDVAEEKAARNESLGEAGEKGQNGKRKASLYLAPGIIVPGSTTVPPPRR